MNISYTGAWLFGGAALQSQHLFDKRLADGIVALANQLGHTKAYDFGCGEGKYTQLLNSSGIQTEGFDGNPCTGSYSNCYVQDLTDASFSKEPRPFVVSLEVCEHVPKELEEVLLSTIDRHVDVGGTLVLSWAIVGQGGLGHVNCQNNDYVIAKLRSMGYTYEAAHSKTLRQASDGRVAPWFSNTILVFSKVV